VVGLRCMRMLDKEFERVKKKDLVFLIPTPILV
jgi:hypothetical protein